MLKFNARMIGRIFKAVKKRMFTFLTGIVFAVFCFIALNATMEPVSTSEYCGSKCHEMNISYLSWELSPHGANAHGVRIECIDCHLPPKDKYFTHITAKAYTGAKDIYKHYFGRNTISSRFARRFWSTYRVRYTCIVMLIYLASRAILRRESHIRRCWPSPVLRRTGVSNVTKMPDTSVKTSFFHSRKGRKEP